MKPAKAGEQPASFTPARSLRLGTSLASVVTFLVMSGLTFIGWEFLSFMGNIPEPAEVTSMKITTAICVAYLITIIAVWRRPAWLRWLIIIGGGLVWYVIAKQTY